MVHLDLRKDISCSELEYAAEFRMFELYTLCEYIYRHEARRTIFQHDEMAWDRANQNRGSRSRHQL